MPKLKHSIESPIIVFNNITNNITQELEQILFESMPKYKFDKTKSVLAINGKIIFDNKSIILLDYLKLHIVNNELEIKILRPSLKFEHFQTITNLTKNWDRVSTIFYHYLLMYNNIANGYDSVPNSFIENLVKQIKTKNIKEDEYFIVPYKTKINVLYDGDKKFIEKIFNRYSYIIKFVFNKNKFTYKIYRVTPNELNQNKNNLNNLRFTDCDLINTNTIDISNSEQFITKLFNYGELITK